MSCAFPATRTRMARTHETNRFRRCNEERHAPHAIVRSLASRRTDRVRWVRPVRRSAGPRTHATKRTEPTKRARRLRPVGACRPCSRSGAVPVRSVPVPVGSIPSVSPALAGCGMQYKEKKSLIKMAVQTSSDEWSCRVTIIRFSAKGVCRDMRVSAERTQPTRGSLS